MVLRIADTSLELGRPYPQDLGLIHSTNGNHLESPNEGSSIDHQQQLRVPQLANHSLQKWYGMIELRKRSPTLPCTYQTTAGNDGNCRRKVTVNSNLGFEAKNTIGENILTGTNNQLQPADAKKPAAEISNNANQNDVVEHYLRLPQHIKRSVATNQNGVAPLTSSNLVDNSRAIPAASYSSLHQLQATVTNKSLAAGQPVTTSKRRRFLLALQ
ncbi:hypothetical protein F511_15221 [Dorcoceras hygrometricum]|uniref:Uncharacterized protein n=1 Tax=Dorcoceras hygrometricum TaxID=472368 RepID=A0A2Z7CW61_9LAMI|nr:hypothetical protein F511_15221 [Dorcoceras hygrometricum]